MTKLRVYIGWDPREADAFAVAEASLRRHASIAVEVVPLMLEDMRARRLYRRPTERRDGRLWDVISDAPMATEFALTRFLLPHLEAYGGWSLFCDCDFLFRADVAELLDYMDERRAVVCVHHHHVPVEGLKMDGQAQSSYPRKNWSSFALWNNGHLKHAGQVERVNRWPGLMLQQFLWLDSVSDFGVLPLEWNWLEGVSRREHIGTGAPIEPKAVHYTRGVPNIPGYENAAYADEWREELARARAGAAVPA